MEFEEYFPIWNQLTPEEQRLLKGAAAQRAVPGGALLHNGAADCVGLFVIGSGQLRAFLLSGEGREITLYRLFERDMCLFSASCMMNSIQFDITIEAEKDTLLWVIPPELYKGLMERSLPVANYTNQLMASRFSEVMWRVDDILWKSFDKRLAAFLLEESALDGNDTLRITHERIAAHMGTAREVVTRMLRYFQDEGMVRLQRGSITLLNRPALTKLAG